MRNPKKDIDVNPCW